MSVNRQWSTSVYLVSSLRERVGLLLVVLLVVSVLPFSFVSSFTSDKVMV